MTRRRRLLALATPLLAALAAAPPAGAAAIWRLEQPPPPPGARFKVPLGPPGDMEFLAPNHGLLVVVGNAVVSPGLFFWDGAGWHELSTVCGGVAETSRIAWAGPDEFWTVTEPSQPRTGDGMGLCHFKNGVVVGSYSTPLQSADPYHTMDAAACNGPSDCWFGGVVGQDPTGQRVGAFHLHWDGSGLTSFYEPQGRGTSALDYFGGTFYETTFVGAAPEDRTDPASLGSPEPMGPILIHRLQNGSFQDVNYLPPPYPGAPSDGAEMLSVHDDGSDLWFAGGGAASGPDAPQDGSVARPPLLAHLVGPFYQNVPFDQAQFGPTDRFVDVAPVAGTSTAWVADQPFADRASTTAHATVALVGANGTTQAQTLPSSGAGRGAAALVAFSGPNEGWMATTAGWLFHYTDGTVYPQDTDPAFQGTITQRPNESVAQFVPDTPPPDNSQLFAPPPVQVAQTTTTAPQSGGYIPALLQNIRVRRRGLTLMVSFRLTRLASVALVARRRRVVVAQTPRKRLGAGRHMLMLHLSLERYPTALRLQTKELTVPKPVPCPTGVGSKTGSGSTTGTGNDSPIAVTTQCGAAGSSSGSGSGSDTVSTG